jgi:hypothetical protein
MTCELFQDKNQKVCLCTKLQITVVATSQDYILEYMGSTQIAPLHILLNGPVKNVP